MTTSPIQLTQQGNVSVVTLDDGRGNALSTTMLQALLDTAESVRNADAVLLLGRPKVFCGGLNLEEVVPMDRAALGAFLDLFHRAMTAWLALPPPVVCAVSGSAVAGGAILLMSADVRVGADDSGIVGVNEARLGVPFPSVALELVRSGMDPTQAQRALLLGELLPKRGALARGFFHELASPDLLHARALELAKDLATLPHQASHATKAMLRQEHIQRARDNAASSLAAFMDAWLSPVAQERLRAVVARLKR
jgi:enoyl-CoA hydratase